MTTKVDLNIQNAIQKTGNDSTIHFTQSKEILIFRTSVNSSKEIKILKPLLDRLIGLENWSFDLEDCDNILRVYAKPSMNDFLAEAISKIGF